MSSFPRRNSLSDAVKERRLRPIYELLDGGHNKKVIQEADRLLKKQSGFLCVKVLKGLAFLRMEKREECLSLINPVFEEGPTDENTIQALTICYRELDRPDLVCQLLENATKKDKSEDLMTSCFMSHVRVADFQKQHQTAMSLYKSYPKVPYFSWAVMSLYAKCVADPESTDKISLPLAERMMAKFIADNQIGTEHELFLYLLILMKGNKFQVAFEIMETFSKDGPSWKTGVLPQMMRKCLKETDQTDKLVSFYESLILIKPDDFQYGVHYVREFGTKYPDRVRKFLQDAMPVRAISPNGFRSCLLGRMLLFKILQQKAMENADSESDFYEALHEYVRVFGGKPFCLSDIDIFLPCVRTAKDQDELVEVTDFLTKATYPVFESVQRQMNLTSIKHFLQYVEISSDPLKIIDSIGFYVLRYMQIRETLIDEKYPLDPRDGYPHDDFITLSSFTLVESFWVSSDIWKEYFILNDMRRFGLKTDDQKTVQKENSTTEDESSLANGFQNNQSDVTFYLSEEDFPIFLSLALLEYGLERSQSCSQMRVLLGKVYTFCGAVVSGTKEFMSLDIKHAQIESLGYLYLWKTLSSGVMDDSFSVLYHAESFYNTHNKESVEHILSAYKYGSWEKIIEFSSFRESILRSTQGMRVKVEKKLLEYTRDAVSHEHCLQVAQREQFDAVREIFDVTDLLQENRDFKLLTLFCKAKISDEVKQLTFEDDHLLLQVRGCFLSILNNLVLVTAELKDDAKCNERMNYIEKMMPFVEEILRSDYKRFDVCLPSIDGPWGPKMFQLKSSGCFDIIFGFVKTLFKIVKEQNTENIAAEIESLDKIINAAFKASQADWQTVTFALRNLSKLTEGIFSMVEALGFCCVMADVLKSILQNLSSNSKKTKKKKPKEVEAPMESSAISSFNKLVETIACCLSEIEKQIAKSKFATGEWFPSTWAELQEMWKGKVSDEIYYNLLPFVLPAIMNKLNKSYYRAYNEINILAMTKKIFAENLRNSIQ